MTIYGEQRADRFKLFHASKIETVQLTGIGTGPVKSTFLVTFTDCYFVAAVFSHNETHRSGNWISLS